MSREEAFRRLESAYLIASNKVEGTAVWGRKGDPLGSVEKVMIDKRTGQVAYVVVLGGDILGFGGRRFPVPWEALSYDEDRDGYLADMETKDLSLAPSFGDDDEPDWTDPRLGQSLHDYYGLPIRLVGRTC